MNSFTDLISYEPLQLRDFPSKYQMVSKFLVNQLHPPIPILVCCGVGVPVFPEEDHAGSELRRTLVMRLEVGVRDAKSRLRFLGSAGGKLGCALTAISCRKSCR